MMRIVGSLFVLALASGFNLPAQAETPLNQLNEAERRSGWKLLFDGKTTTGWRNYRAKNISDGWAVQNGILNWTKKGAGDLVSEKQFKHFELSIEYRISKGGNSGIMFHVTEQAQYPWQSGPEIQIQDNVDGRDPEKAGWLYQLYRPVKPNWAKFFESQVGFTSPEISDATRPAGQWNHLYIRIGDKKSEVALNGVSYYYFQKGSKDWNERVAKSKFASFAGFGKSEQGHICLQDHGNAVAFRNIKVRELAADGSVPDPVDRELPLQAVEAFPKLKWEGWQGVDDNGKIRQLRPIEIIHGGDGTNRLFVGTQSGMIHVFDNDPEVKSTSMYLDLRDRVHDWTKDNEEGLLGMALHPNYKTNGEIFVYYNTVKKPRTAYLSRFRRSADNPNRGDPASEEIIMVIPQPFANHNGGPMVFGRDGYLYLALGDGGGRNDPTGHGQNLKTWMGSMLRIDVDHKEKDLNYAIPKDNPFLDRPGAKPEIYAYGLRNIWRLSIDRQTGLIWSADVGQDLWEEINIIKRGANYGWSIREASYGFGNAAATNPDKPVDPLWEYDHQIGKSITGGHVYRGKKLPELFGYYIYGDYVSGKIWALKYDEKTNKVIENVRIPSTGLPVLAFGQDEHGEVYYMIATATGKTIFRFERKK